MKKKKRKTNPTIKQKRAVANMVENGGNVSKSMRQAGYKKSTAKNPKKLTSSKGFKEEAKTFIQKLKDERLKALNAMKLKRGKAKYRDCSDAVDKLTKVIQLLGENPTEISKLKLDDKQFDQLFGLIARGKKGADSRKGSKG